MVFTVVTRLHNMAGVQDLSVTKRPHLMKKIGAHNGMFHCDEALACFMLKQLPEYKEAEVIRTREPALLNTCDVVVDVGGIYDHARKRYDHHQREFCETMNSLNADYPWTTKLSSAGLVYFHYGHQVLAEIMGTTPSDTLTRLIFMKVYEFFVEAIDAVDNGISQTEEKPKYAVTTSLSARVGNLNPRWNQTVTQDDVQDRFHKAMSLTGSEFVDKVKYYSEAWWPARKIVEDAIAKRFEVDPSGEVMLLPRSCPWKDHLFSVEDEQEIQPTIKFVLFTDQSGKWRVQCVPVELFSFDNRLSLLETWRGVRDEELSKMSGIPGCIFVHAGGFIGGCHSYDGVLEMARRTLQARATTAN
ncbi:hypothetical protein NP493_570g04001 [Ridgeia piscesae]|uniref:Uncharacterized protein n=1 Tax=Ridgeia piscesae TaxID=27915 RepID=A0AAD9NRE8_RIDPI|nr:hypothetical protein NP493_570g04001 [Ridgeia piscesae]